MDNYHIGDMTKSYEIGIYDLSQEGSNEIALARILGKIKKRNITIRLEIKKQNLSSEEKLQLYKVIIPLMIKKFVDLGHSKNSLSFIIADEEMRPALREVFPGGSVEKILF